MLTALRQGSDEDAAKKAVELLNKARRRSPFGMRFSRPPENC